MVECLVVGCSTHKDCPPDRMCLNGKCMDPCVYNNTCGHGAVCRTVDRTLECSCPGRLKSDPRETCPPIIKQACQADSDCVMDLACLDNVCVNPCEVLKPCASYEKCSVVDTRPIRNMICTCPNLMVPTLQGKCTDRKQYLLFFNFHRNFFD